MDNHVIESFKDTDINVMCNNDGTKNVCLNKILVRNIDTGEINTMKICIDNIKSSDFHYFIDK